MPIIRDYIDIKELPYTADVVVRRGSGSFYVAKIYDYGYVIMDDGFKILKRIFEEILPKQNKSSITVLLKDLDVTVPENECINISIPLNMLEIHCMNCNFKREKYTGVPTKCFSVDGSKIRNFIFNGHDSTVFYDIGRPFCFDTNGSTDMDYCEFHNFTMYIPDEYIGSGRWGGFGIGFNFPGTVPESDYHVKYLVINNVRAYNNNHRGFPECVLFYSPRIYKLYLNKVEAYNCGTLDEYGIPSTFWNVIETYGVTTLNAQRIVYISKTRLVGIIGLRSENLYIDDSDISRTFIVAPFVLSIDETNRIVNCSKDVSIIVESSIIRGGLTVPVNYHVQEATNNVYTIDGKYTNIRISNSEIILAYETGYATIGGIYMYKAPIIPIDTLEINDSTVYARDNTAPLIEVRYGGNINYIGIHNVEIIPDPFNGRNASLLVLSDGNIADLNVFKLSITDTSVRTFTKYMYFGENNSNYKTNIEHIIIDNLFLHDPGNIEINTSAQLKFDSVKLSGYSIISSGLLDIPAGSTVDIYKITVFNAVLLIGELYKYDPDNKIKVQIYNIDNDTIYKEFDTGNLTFKGWLPVPGNYSYTIRLVNTDTTNSHKVNLSVVYVLKSIV